MMSIRAATTALKSRLRTVASPVGRRHQSSNGRPDRALRKMIADAEALLSRERIAANDLIGRKSNEAYVNEYKLLPNYFGASSYRKEVSAYNDDKKPIFFVHRRRSSDDMCLTAVDANLSPKYDISPPFPHPYSCLDYECCTSSNGLVSFQKRDSSIFIWNPTTNEFKILSQSQAFLDASPRPSMKFSRIWFDPKSEDYKVVRLFWVGKNDHSSYVIELYSFKTDSWKKISCPDDIVYCGSRGVCINGVFYTEATLKRRGLVPPKYEHVILSFDFSTETTCILPSPPLFFISSHFFLDYNGLLSVFACEGWISSNPLWVMRDGKWDLVSLYHMHACDARQYPLGFSRNGKLLFFESRNELMVFDSATGKLKHVDGCASYHDGYSTTANLLHLIPFSESLVKL